MNPITRAVGTHVEFESDSWVSAFNVTIQLGKLCRSFGQAFHQVDEGSNGLELARGLSKLTGVMTNIYQPVWGRSTYTASYGGGKEYECVGRSNVSEKNSFHHPLTWLWAEMAKNVGKLDKRELSNLGIQGGLSELVGVQNGAKFFLAVMEQPLRGKSQLLTFTLAFVFACRFRETD